MKKSFKDSGLLQAFILNKPNDEIAYGLDLVSGKKYAKAPLCEQKDVWGKYDKPLDKFSFSVGVIPRSLLGSGEPYPVYVFGEREKILKSGFNYHTHEIRVIGGVNLQDCPKVNCRGGQWRNNIIPVGVFTNDDRLKSVQTLEDLTFHFDMNYFYSFIQNYKGRITGDRKDFPSYRLLSTLNLQDTVRFLEAGAHQFSPEKVFFLKRNCGNLYKNIWKDVSQLKKKKNEKDLSEYQVIKNYQKKILGKTVVDENFTELKIRRKQEGQKGFLFSRWLKEFVQKDQSNFELCSRFVRYSNNRGEKWRLLLHLDLFTKLNKMGFIYACSTRSWNKNYRNNDGSWVYSQTEYLENCSDRDLDRGFEIAANYMGYERNKNNPYYEYLKNDPVFGSSHEKIYGWVLRNGKQLRCEDKKGEQIFESMAKRKILKPGSEWERLSKD